jgi:hypothetical protein
MKTSHLTIISGIIAALLAVVAWNALEQMQQRHELAALAEQRARDIKAKAEEAARIRLQEIRADVAAYEEREKADEALEAQRKVIRERESLLNGLLAQAHDLVMEIGRRELDKFPTTDHEAKLAIVVATLKRLNAPAAAAAAASRNPNLITEQMAGRTDDRIQAALDSSSSK